MPREFGRNQRIAHFIREELATLIQRELPLNEYGMITLTDVDVSPDLKNATVLFTVLGDQYPVNETVNSLNELAGHFRHELSTLMTSKGVPSLRFKYDESIARAQRLDELIDSVSKHKQDDND